MLHSRVAQPKAKRHQRFCGGHVRIHRAPWSSPSREKPLQNVRACVCVCVCVCVPGRERERERESVCVCVFVEEEERMTVCMWKCV